jgi:type VI secretion system protein ImpL
LSPAEAAAHAAAIRARLIELHQRLEVDFPVYALFTKADLVIGFMEFFNGLDEPGRAQVWGATFQTMDKTKSMLADVPAEFEALLQRLNQQVPARLDDEKDPASRVLSFGFPAQIAALRPQVIGFLNKIFDPAQYKINAALRGFYFTSGTQQGTPIDQLLGALAKGFGAEAVGTPAYSGQGKSFFLTDLIKNVVIGEAGWVSTGRTNRLLRMAALAGVLALSALAVAALWVSYARNSQEIGQTEEAAAAYKAQSGLAAANAVSDHDLSKVLKELHELRYLPSGYADQASSANSGGSLGLNQTGRLKSAAGTAYGIGLERLLRPRLVFRLEEQLEEKAGDPAQQFEALKVYLMLGGLETVDRQLLINWMERDWSENLYPGPKASEGRKELEQHLVAMLDLENGHGSFVSLNGPLVAKTQAALARLNVAERAYQILAARAKAALRDDWTAVKAGGAGAQLVFTDAIETIQIPYFLTKPGFQNFFLEKLPGISEEMTRDRWVLGSAGEQPAISAQYDGLQVKLVDYYVKMFTDAWREGLGRLKIRRLTAERPVYPLMAAAASVTSPFTRILESVRDETLFSEEPENAAPDAASAGSAAAGVAGSSGQAPARMIDAALSAYHRAVEGQPGQRPIDLLTSRLSQIRDNLNRFAANGARDDQLRGKIASETAKLKTEASALPRPFAQMFETTADDVTIELADAAAARSGDVHSAISLTCEERIASRYPFKRSAGQEVTLDDFTRMFGPKGLIDQFVNDHILTAADTSGSEWKWRGDSALSKQLGASGLADFQRAAEVRDAFFGAGASAPGFVFSITPPAVSAAKLEIDGTTIDADGANGATNVSWPGAAETEHIALSVESRGRAGAALERSGVWAIYRMLDAGRVSSDASSVRFSIGGRDLNYRLNATPASPGATFKPLDLTQLRRFRCPNGA